MFYDPTDTQELNKTKQVHQDAAQGQPFPGFARGDSTSLKKKP